MSNLSPSKPKSPKSNKHSRITTSITKLVKGALNSKPIHQTPIYIHGQGALNFSGSRVQSDFVYIDPHISKHNKQKNITKSDTTCDQSGSKKTKKKSAEVSKLLRTDPNNSSINEIVEKKNVFLLRSNPPPPTAVNNKENDDFKHFEEMRSKYSKPGQPKYTLTEEDKSRIQDTLPPGEPIIIPKFLTRVFDKNGKFVGLVEIGHAPEQHTYSGNVRTCLCHVSPNPNCESDASKSIDRRSKKVVKPKRTVSFMSDDKDKQISKSKRSASADSDKRRSNHKKSTIGVLTTDVKRILTYPRPSLEDMISAFDKYDMSRFHPKRKAKPKVVRPVEKKVDEDDPYKALVSVSKGRLNRSQYQLYYNLRIRGPSAIADLKFDPVKIYCVSIAYFFQ